MTVSVIRERLVTEDLDSDDLKEAKALLDELSCLVRLKSSAP